MQIEPQEDKNIILKLKEIGKIKYIISSPEYIREAIHIAMLREHKTITIKESEWLNIQNKTKEREEFNHGIQQTAMLNNKGIEAEANGDLPAAIKYYEQNIKNKCVATHSYDRLMILYKKLNMVEKELKVTDAAIIMFSIENQKRYLRAMDNAENLKYQTKIEAAHQDNTGIKNDEGIYIYSPYNVVKYVSRANKIRTKRGDLPTK